MSFAGFAGSWLLSSVLYASASASAPPAAPAPAPPAQTPASAPPPPASSAKSPATPDEGLLEFLGSDDVGDSAWWEFLKKAPPRGNDPRAVPPQDAKK